MPSSRVDAAEAQWVAQLTAMRAALADLKLPPTQTNVAEQSYGSDIDFDGGDVTSGNSGDDVWDFISETEEELYSSDFVEAEAAGYASTSDYGPQWLKSKCIGFAGRKQGLSSEDLEEQIIALLASDSVEEELQSTLTDIIGFDDLDFVIELISHRKEIASASPFAATPADPIMGRLQTKRQREEALRKRDYEHKHATLGPSLDRDGPQYPHVYKAHSAGNTLAAGGKKYSLPMGSERTEHEVRDSTTPIHKHN
jgi:antiviral helicase SLH1